MKPVSLIIIVALLMFAGGFYLNSITKAYETKLSIVELQVDKANKEKELLSKKITYLSIEKNFLLTAPEREFRFILPNEDYSQYAQIYSQETLQGTPLKTVKESIITISPISDTDKSTITTAVLPQTTLNNGKIPGHVYPLGFYKNQFVYSIEFDGRGGECDDPWVDNSGNLYSIITNPTTNDVQTPQKFTITPEVKGWILKNTSDACKAQMSIPAPVVVNSTQ